ncbi:YraN family protein [Psychroserpens sp.]|uniref:YraN family protein n=1 Tax=Psychroserpens sp. TaxID=2020870 RepID=UPI001B1F5DD0|nr:YraN family protein [Psychroserpens sp.]MBO6605523.1 YraN family protein [Psychroserpens sp.]MBO6630194.1 YraN family protein [Psychroserpens sp.]MBO6653668.1 YraN family protein [Psychroserpens sp.]MBO6681989.1 YraN family protein [Psychroserpens sp.]MBO6748897.1 YraN family protein [Psychroserpens sp.]
MAVHNDLGKHGEQIAIDYLMAKGYQILETNYRFQKAEVDIIAKMEDTLAVVEVKTRSTKVFGDPHEFLKPKQIERIVTVIDHYIQSKQLDVEVRFDVIAIVKTNSTTDIQHLENAYFHF